MNGESANSQYNSNSDLKTLRLVAMRQLLMEFERLVEKLREAVEIEER